MFIYKLAKSAGYFYNCSWSCEYLCIGTFDLQAT
jgi:hypothetical protein